MAAKYFRHAFSQRLERQASCVLAVHLVWNVPHVYIYIYILEQSDHEPVVGRRRVAPISTADAYHQRGRLRTHSQQLAKSPSCHENTVLFICSGVGERRAVIVERIGHFKKLALSSSGGGASSRQIQLHKFAKRFDGHGAQSRRLLSLCIHGVGHIGPETIYIYLESIIPNTNTTIQN